jgi:NitT/TauT family transport system ATP-binding protein
VLEVTDLTRAYGHAGTAHLALKDVSLQVADGELVSIVGPSGCGKSTLLRCIAGLLAPTSGRVVLNGTPVTHVPDRLAVVFQDYSRSLYPWLSVRDNVALPLRRTMHGRAARRQAALASLAAVGLSDIGTRYPWQLSGGMQQRVSIARALAFEPSLLLMDEPFGALDEMTRERLNLELLSIWQQLSSTVVFVTHSITEAVFLSTRVVVMSPRPGRIAGIVPIDLPHPRTVETREDSRFFALVTEVRELLRLRGEHLLPEEEAAL